MKRITSMICFILSSWLMITFCHVGAQDALPVQHFQFRHFSNPAYSASSAKDYRILAMSRKQWGWLPGGFSSNLASAEMGFFRNKSELNALGAAVIIMHDKAGKPAMQTFNAQLNLATHLQLDAGLFFSTGIAGKIIQRSLSFSDLRWDSQYNGVNHDPSIDAGENISDMKRTIFDLAWGAAVSGNSGNQETTVGYAFHHFRQNESLLINGTSKLPMLHELSAFHLRKMGKMDWMADVRINRQAGAMMITTLARLGYRFGADSRYTDFRTSTKAFAGIGYRWTDAIIVVAGCEFQKTANIGIAYEMTTSKVSDVSGSNGAMEIVLSWSGFRTYQRRSLSK